MRRRLRCRQRKFRLAVRKNNRGRARSTIVNLKRRGFRHIQTRLCRVARRARHRQRLIRGNRDRRSRRQCRRRCRFKINRQVRRNAVKIRSRRRG